MQHTCDICWGKLDTDSVSPCRRQHSKRLTWWFSDSLDLSLLSSRLLLSLLVFVKNVSQAVHKLCWCYRQGLPPLRFRSVSYIHLGPQGYGRMFSFFTRMSYTCLELRDGLPSKWCSPFMWFCDYRTFIYSIDPFKTCSLERYKQTRTVLLEVLFNISELFENN